MIRSKLVALGFAFLAHLALSAEARAQSPRLPPKQRSMGPVINLRLASGGDPPVVAESFVAFRVFEGDEGGRDLNGDGDASDNVVHIWEPGAGVSSLGIEGFHLVVSERWLAFSVGEAAQGNQDLNGDGDALDRVVHVYDTSSGVLRNLGLSASLPSQDILHGRSLAILVEEFDQGGTDLNGDGDAFDSVAHVHRLDLATTRNLGLAARSTGVWGDQVMVSVGEAEQGFTDLNGDGDTTDSVVHVHHVLQATTVNLGLQSFGGMVRHGAVAFSVTEIHQGGADLNGDGDTDDVVLHVHEAGSGVTTNLGVDANPTGLEATTLSFAVSEAGQGGVDLNGDGDAADGVVHWLDRPTGAVTNVGLATGPLLHRGPWIGIEVFENRQGDQDLNGDLDVLDQVLHLHDTRTSTTRSVGLATSGFELGDAAVAFRVPEAQQGGQDRNGDGDATDFVLHTLIDLNGSPRNHGLASDGVLGVHPFVSLEVPETHQGRRDLNRDGDTGDRVVHLLDLRSEHVRNLRHASIVTPVAGSRLAALVVPELGQGRRDLNGDGDRSDRVVHVLRTER